MIDGLIARKALWLCVLLAEGTLSWKSAKQSIVATSTMETEFVACFGVTVYALWLRNFTLGLGVVNTIIKPLKIFCDNSTVIFFSNNNKYSKVAKHMEIKYFAVKEELKKQRMILRH